MILRERSRGRQFRNAQELLADLSPAASERVQNDLARFLTVAAFETREVEINSVGWVEGSPVRVHATAVVVRGGEGTIVTWRRVE